MEPQKDNKGIQGYKENYLLESVFIKDTDLQFLFKKTEKIITAIYLVTNFLIKDEPVKWSLRQSATKLLESFVSYSQSSTSNKEKTYNDFNVNILEMSSLFDLTYNVGFVTKMNYDILNNEIGGLSNAIRSYHIDSSSKTLFNEESFHVEKISGQNMTDTANGSILNKSDINKENVLYKGHESKGHNNVLYKKRPINKVISNTNQDRRNKILSEIKKKGDVSVKDIALVITGYSEKTLQRELISMVTDGILKKEGERRWSRYSMK